LINNEKMMKALLRYVLGDISKGTDDQHINILLLGGLVGVVRLEKCVDFLQHALVLEVIVLFIFWWNLPPRVSVTTREITNMGSVMVSIMFEGFRDGFGVPRVINPTKTTSSGTGNELLILEAETGARCDS